MQELGVNRGLACDFQGRKPETVEWLGHDPQQPLVVKHEAGQEAKTIMEK